MAKNIITLKSDDEILNYGNDFHNLSTNNEPVQQIVSAIITNIKSDKGAQYLLDYTEKFDNVKYTADTLKVTAQEIENAYDSCDSQIIDSLRHAAKRITAYHEKQMPQDELYIDESGVELGWKWTAIDKVGLYVPGGQAAYPSSVLMNAIPAQVANVKQLVMVVPAPQGYLNPSILAAAKIANVTEIYKVGGAQAIAALAYGVAPIPKVNKIVGPGNAYVAAAKAQVFGQVGIDMIAGPSEILIISDGKTNPEWLAADLLSQAEHDKDARSVLITDDMDLANAVISAVEEILPTLKRVEIAKTSWDNEASVIYVNNLDQAVDLANLIATEHLELAVDNPQELAKKIHNAGAIFMGRYTPEAIGDYLAGPSHVLPTSGTAKFSSGLGVFDFIKRSSIINCSQTAFSKLEQDTQQLANAEELDAHALSISIRSK